MSSFVTVLVLLKKSEQSEVYVVFYHLCKHHTHTHGLYVHNCTCIKDFWKDTQEIGNNGVLC